MSQIDKNLVSSVVAEVLLQLREKGVNPTGMPTGACSAVPAQTQFGVYDNMEDAIDAAQRSYKMLCQKGVAARRKAVACIRKLAVENAEAWGKMEFEETKIGKLAHKVEKLRSCIPVVPGVEYLDRTAFSGDAGLTVIDNTPWGVIGAITPSTHSVPTLSGNAINMIAAGNAAVFNTHPGACKIAAHAIRAYNEAIYKEIGIPDLLACVKKPTLQSFEIMCKSPTVRLLCVTGGGPVVKAAMNSGKRAICGGPGNPPVVVDETADLAKAARDILAGAAFDNNLLCCGEKEVFVVESVADQLLAEFGKLKCVRLTREQMDAVVRECFLPYDGKGYPHPKKEFVGKDAAVIAKAIGLDVPADTEMLFGETDADHQLVQGEQMMPVMPIVRVPCYKAAIKAALQAEHGFRHTCVMHSKNVDRLTEMAQRCDTTLFVKNGPSTAGLGLGGEGFLSFTIATPTGEGVTTPMTFTRSRRCVMVEGLNLY